MDRFIGIAAVIALFVGFFAAPALAADVEVTIVGLKDGVVQPHAHVHIWLDDQSFNTLTAEPVWVFGGVKPGKHTLHVELVSNNHAPLSPRVKKEIPFTFGKP